MEKPDTTGANGGEERVPDLGSSLGLGYDEPLPVCDYTTDGDEPCEEPSAVRRWSGASVVLAAALGAVAGGLVTAAAAAWALGLFPNVRPLGGAVVSNQSAPIRIQVRGEVDAAVAVASKVIPAVVNVSVEQRRFNPFTGEVELRESGNGSGVIIRADGHILTNYHVIEDADRIMVRYGVDELPAEVAGVDASTDLAVIKVARTGMPEAELGSSDTLKVGQFVVAVGSPFGLERTVTSGIISALGRSSLAGDTQGVARYTNLIQTDAAINPGNSGGALADAQGRVVGINTLIQSPSGAVGAPQSAGIGFAIPIDFARNVADQLIETGRAIHPYMGVISLGVDADIARQLALPVDRGALIDFVEPDSPADKGGLRRGDVVVKVGSRDVSGPEDLISAIRAARIGDELKVVVVRGDTERDLSVTLGSDADRPR